MSKSTPIVATMGIDIGKNSFHVVGIDQRGAIVLCRNWRAPNAVHGKGRGVMVRSGNYSRCTPF